MAGILKVDQVQSDSNLSFQVAGANVAYMNSTGLQMTGGQIIAGSNTLLTASGLIYANAGIAFPATQSASADPNTLDDYEEGTWTTVLTGGGSATAISRTNNYRKIGNQVTVWINYDQNISTGGGSGTTSLLITGLPFVNTGQAVSVACGIRSGMDCNAVYFGGNSVTAAIYKWNITAWDNMKGSNIATDLYFGLVMTYITTT